jgi:hypothetical protein
VDEELVKEGRLQRISSVADLSNLPIQKKQSLNLRRSVGVVDEVGRLILE